MALRGVSDYNESSEQEFYSIDCELTYSCDVKINTLSEEFEIRKNQEDA